MDLFLASLGGERQNCAQSVMLLASVDLSVMIVILLLFYNNNCNIFSCQQVLENCFGCGQIGDSMANNHCRKNFRGRWTPETEDWAVAK